MRRLVLLIAVLCVGGLGAAALAAVDPLADRGRDAVDRAADAPREAVERAADEGREAVEGARERGRRVVESPRRRVRASRCPAELDGCRAVRGRVVYVEAVDPDGDGDLHVVVAAGSVTAPGLTSVDVRPGLRPRRDPRAGDQVSAAGPVQRGSFGQSQIHAVEFRVARAG